MKNTIKNILLGVFIVSLTACSYSPNSLKEIYSHLGSDLSDDIKESINLNPKQEAQIDHYADELMKWHRHNKLPEYAQKLSQLASYVERGNLPLPVLDATLKQMSDFPHFEQATHLTPYLAAAAHSLSDAQIKQLEKSLNDEFQKSKYEIKTTSLEKMVYENTQHTFRFLGSPLTSEQSKIVKEEAKKFHDLRWLELQNEKKWNQQLIAILRESDSQQFTQQFVQLWNHPTIKLKGKALQKERENQLRLAELIKTLVMKLSPEKRGKLVAQLMSIRNTLSEMAN